MNISKPIRFVSVLNPEDTISEDIMLIMKLEDDIWDQMNSLNVKFLADAVAAREA